MHPFRSRLSLLRCCVFMAAAFVAPAPAPGAPAAVVPGISIRHILDTGSGGSSVRIARDPSDGVLYYLRQSGSIYRLDVAPGSGSTSQRVFTAADTGVGSAIGFAFGSDGTVYVVGNERSGDLTAAIIRRGRKNGGGRAWSTVARTAQYPRSNTAFDHTANGIAVSPDGSYLVVNSGSRTDHGEVQSNGGRFPGLREAPLTAKILRVPADATDLTLPNDEDLLRAGGHIFAEGTRNTFDPAFAPNGDLFGGENSGDRDDNEELNWLREGHHYGFPWRIGASETPQQFPGYEPEADRLVDHDFIAYRNGFFHDDPTFPPPPPVAFTDPVVNEGPDADSFRDPATGEVRDASSLGTTLRTFTAHRSPLGLVFDAGRALSPEYAGGAFILGWTRGDATGSAVNGPFRDPGQDLLHLDLRRAGDEYRAAVRRVAGGFLNPIDAEISGNRIYVLEHGGEGAVWEVTLPAADAVSFRRGYINEDGELDIADAVAGLFHLFAGRAIDCDAAADVDDDGELRLADVIFLLTYLVRGGPPPPPPFPACGADPTNDADGALGCAGGAGCNG